MDDGQPSLQRGPSWQGSRRLLASSDACCFQAKISSCRTRHSPGQARVQSSPSYSSITTLPFSTPRQTIMLPLYTIEQHAVLETSPDIPVSHTQHGIYSYFLGRMMWITHLHVISKYRRTFKYATLDIFIHTETLRQLCFIGSSPYYTWKFSNMELVLWRSIMP